ncbi:MAG: Rieske 2Fe-2S domain-containing protein [Sulfurovaceae bacterium]|nr:Rieske 2Fe-2S domain-containing protein [Sulfurovaceae bacterium]MDY0195883.1 Rieske 2Fe-2S domain-containing protein [Sulfurovaceae bacterium]
MSNRRDFMGMALGSFAALGALGALYAAKRTWDPLPSVKSAGFTTIDLSPAQENVLVTEKWRGKPIFILKQPANAPKSDREIHVAGGRYLVVVGLCTHLGCIPAYLADKKQFKCACHGGEFDSLGVNTFGPPPRPLDIPPFKISGTSVILGETGPEYEKMLAAGLTLKV